MKLSLILSSLNRPPSLIERFMASIPTPERFQLELLLVDQNSDQRLEELARAPGPIPLRYSCSAPGLSQGRNAALPHAQGEVIGFPDDDCWYFEDTVDALESAVQRHPSASFFAGRILDANQRLCLHNRWPAVEVPVTAKNINFTVASASLFVHRRVFERIGMFDPLLGVGARFGAAEEVDLIYRALKAGFTGIYCPSIRVGHPAGSAIPDEKRAYSHARGSGYLFRKHHFGYPRMAYHIARPWVASLAAWCIGRPSHSAYYRAVARGRLEGFREPLN